MDKLVPFDCSVIVTSFPFCFCLFVCLVFYLDSQFLSPALISLSHTQSLGLFLPLVSVCVACPQERQRGLRVTVLEGLPSASQPGFIDAFLLPFFTALLPIAPGLADEYIPNLRDNR